ILSCRDGYLDRRDLDARSDPLQHRVEPGFGAQRNEACRCVTASFFGISGHHAKVRPDEWREIHLVDHEQIRARDAWPALSRHLVAASHVDDKDLEVDKASAEGSGQVVPAGFDEHKVECGEAIYELVDCMEVRRDVVADRRVRTAPRLNCNDPVVVEHGISTQEVRVFGCVDVIRHDREVEFIAKRSTKGCDESGLAAPYRAADADTYRCT